MTETRQGIVWLIPLILAGMLILEGCKKTDTYRPVYYPDKYNLTEYVKGPHFYSIEEARAWIYEQNRQRGDEDWDYEIGKNPKPSQYGDIEICEETLR